MKKDDFLLETFDLQYKNGMTAKDNGNYISARTSLLKASATLMQIAKSSQGELKKARLERALRIKAIADNLPSQNISKSELERVKSASSSQKPSSESKDSSSKEESTETVFKSVEIPDISFEDVAGLDEVKESIKMRVILPLQYPEIYKTYNKKIGGGILLYGLPGTGKTMMAKAIAHEVNAKFFAVKCSDIVSKWFGEAEKNVKNLFETARKEDKAVIFFDEFEAIATKRGGGESTNVMNRLVPELLAQIQGFTSSENNLLLLAATNRPWDIDSAMLRPGRFNELIYIGLPDAPAREYMISRALKNIPMDEDVKISEIVELTEGYNGADVTEFCERLKDNPIRKSIETQGKIIFNIAKSDIDYAKSKVKSSIQEKDIKDLENFMSQFDKK